MARGASPAELRRAYRRRLVAVHPDKPGGAPEAFAALQAAYAVLADPEERLIYDEHLELRVGPFDSSGGGGGGGGSDACRGGGATAVVHGQTQGTTPQQHTQEHQTQQQTHQQRAARGCCGSTQLQEATAELQRLQAGGSAAAELAAGHLRRAELHQEAGALHHALFDAEEAARLQPGDAQAAALAAALLAAIEGERVPSAGAGCLDADGSTDTEELW